MSDGRYEIEVPVHSVETEEQNAAPIEAPGPTELAEKLHRLKKAALSAAERRERIPVPLYWSLFHSQVREMRKAKEKERLLRSLLLTGPD